MAASAIIASAMNVEETKVTRNSHAIHTCIYSHAIHIHAYD